MITLWTGTECRSVRSHQASSMVWGEGVVVKRCRATSSIINSNNGEQIGQPIVVKVIRRYG